MIYSHANMYYTCLPQLFFILHLMSQAIPYQIEAKPKSWPFKTSQNDFFVYDPNFAKILKSPINNKQVRIGSNNSLVVTKRQAII